MWKLWLGLSLSLFLASSAGAQQIGSHSQPIVNGSMSRDGIWPSVAFLDFRVPEKVAAALGQGSATLSMCTGVLIAPDVILTATHCIVGPLAMANGFSWAQENGYLGESAPEIPDGELRELVFGFVDDVANDGVFKEMEVEVALNTTYARAGGERIRATSYRLDPAGSESMKLFQAAQYLIDADVDPGVPLDPTTLGRDFAVIYLEQPALTPPSVLANASSSSANLAVGSAGMAVGFGTIDPTADTDLWDGRLREANLTIHDTACGKGVCQPGNEFHVKGAAGVTPCEGDSGGPFFVNNGQNLVVTGIASRIPVQGLKPGMPCTGENGLVYGNVSAARDFIDRALADGPPEGGGGCGCDTNQGPSSLLLLLLALVPLLRRRSGSAAG